MRSGRLVTFVLFAVAATVVGCSSGSSDSDTEQSAPTLGEWHGQIEIPDHPLALGVNFTDASSATIDIPAQGLSGAPLKEVRTDPEAVEFAIAAIPGDPRFRGRFDAETETIVGDFTQSGQSFPLRLARGKVEEPARPQEPKPPFPYKSEDVTYRSGDITIAGTLTAPEGAGPFPAVLLITGSGPQDRDEQIVGHKPFLLIADTLTRAGYAVLRADDRGVGGTGGDLEESNYTDLSGDAAAGVGFLRGRSEIDPTRIGLFGHSEGGYLAPLVAARPDSGVAFVVLMAGPAVPGSEVLIEQNRLIGAATGTPPEEVDTRVRQTTELVDVLKRNDIEGAQDLVRRQNAELPEDQRVSDEQLTAGINPILAALVNYDPAPALSALRVPVFAFYGGHDLQVPAAQSEQPMREHLAADPDATVHVFPGLNHLMQPAPTGNPSEYAGIETTVAPEVLTYVTDWLDQRTRK
ncbi:alpha/beta hydrolase family protein [Nocardia callitridis]|uniref:Alpha/beta hydrolase n=1 Tax=Nocardia callitridis TaxID=648753 RepID=A0ABP9KRW5_9NOCA